MKVNEWFNSKHVQTFIYDTPQKKERIAYRQCRAEYDETKHICLINYMFLGWLNERRAQFQLQRYIRETTNTSRSIITVENENKSCVYGKQCKIQILYITDKPEITTLLQIEEKIKTIGESAPLIIADQNKYIRKTYGEDDIDQI